MQFDLFPPFKPSTVQRGASAEDLAVRALRDAGYRIVERNWRCKAGELDIVARDGMVLCFVEVRSRADDRHGQAAEMVDQRKRAAVSKVAAFYLQFRQPRFTRTRFDVVAITGTRIDLIRDAWRLSNCIRNF